MITLDASDLINGIPDEERDNEDFAAQVVAKTAMDVFRDLRKAPPGGSPVDKGDFKRAWTISQSGEEWVIDNALPYAPRLVYDHWSKQVPIDWVDRIVAKRTT